MALPAVVDTIESVPEAIRGEYVARDGKFHLAVEGMVSKDRLEEFRNNNIAFKRERDDLLAKYDGVDVDKYKELTALEIKQRDKKLIDAGKVDEIVDARLAAYKAESDKTLGAITGERDATKKQLESLLIDGALKDAAIKSGVTPTGVDDVVLRGRGVFRLHDGKASAFDGDKAIYGKDSEPLSVSEWVAGLAERAPHLFVASQGGGAPKGQNNTGATGKTITRADFAKMDPMAQREAALDKNTTIVN